MNTRFAQSVLWQNWGLYNTNRINPLRFEGCSPSLYQGLVLGANLYDYQVQGTPLCACNLVFQMEEAIGLDESPTRNFWFEVSTWASCDYWPLSTGATSGNSDCSRMRAACPTYTPARHGGLCQWILWTLRPRALRHFASTVVRPQEVYGNHAWWDATADAIDRVWNNATLREFWRASALVVRTDREHPYQTSVPEEYASVNRMSLLKTDREPLGTWALTTTLTTYAMARVLGTMPNRRWLVYVWTIPDDIDDVVVTIPDYGDVTLDGTTGGSFYVVDEATDAVSEPLAASTAGVCDSFKLESLTGTHDLANDTIKLAFYVPDASIGSHTTAYSSIGEVASDNYPPGGVTLSNATPDASGTSAVWSASGARVVIGEVTFTTDACLVYNASKGNKAIAVHTFERVSLEGVPFEITVPADLLRYD
jgi:hypothetical protein